MYRRSTIPTVAILALLTMLAAGCATNVPTTLSAAKFVRETPAEQDDHYGKVSATGAFTGTTSKTDNTDDRSWSGVFFTPEAAWTRWISQQYDLSVSAGNQLLNLDGNYWLVEPGTRVGLVHGLGLGYQFNRSGTGNDQALWNHNLFVNGQAGVILQGSNADDGTFFAAARYTFSTLSSWQAGDTGPGDTSDFLPAHFATANAGWLASTDSGASIAPELSFSYGRLVDQNQSTFILTLGATVTAPH